MTDLVRRGGNWGGGDVPGQELCDAVDRVVGDARQEFAQVGLGIKPVELRRSDQAVESGRTLSAAVGRQFIVPEFWLMKSQLHTLFILLPSSALSLWASMSTTVHLTFSSAERRKRDTCSRPG